LEHFWRQFEELISAKGVCVTFFRGFAKGVSAKQRGAHATFIATLLACYLLPTAPPFSFTLAEGKKYFYVQRVSLLVSVLRLCLCGCIQLGYFATTRRLKRHRMRALRRETFL